MSHLSGFAPHGTLRAQGGVKMDECDMLQIGAPLARRGRAGRPPAG